MAINSKVADSSQNSYVSLSEANEYFRTRRNTSDWDNLDTPSKEEILIQAAREIDMFNFIGGRYYDNQGLEFPRDDHEIVSGNCATPITINSFKNTSLYSTTYNSIPTNYWKYGSVHITEATPLYDVRSILSSVSTTGVITVSTDFTGTPTTNTEFLIFAPIYEIVKNAQCEQALFITNNAKIDTLVNYKDLGVSDVRIGDVNIKFSESPSNRLAMSPTAKRLLARYISKYKRIARA